MNRIDRLMAIVVLLQGRRVIRAEDIASHFEISLRTVYRDIAALGESGIPIMAEAGVGYSLVKGYHLPPVMFTAEEAGALFTGGQLVQHLTDSSLRKEMESALLKIRSVLPRERQDFLDRLERSTTVLECHSGAAAPRLASETLLPIQRAIAERRVLALGYTSGRGGESTRREAEPLGLVYYSGHWHLIAYCRMRQDFRDFRTDRITSLQLKGEVFRGHEEFSVARHMESVMSAEGQPTAQVKFHPSAMERARREWSGGLVSERPAGAVVLATLLIYSSERLAAWLLSFGGKAEVISPLSLRDLVRAEAERALRLYSLPPSKLAKEPAEKPRLAPAL